VYSKQLLMENNYAPLKWKWKRIAVKWNPKLKYESLL